MPSIVQVRHCKNHKKIPTRTEHRLNKFNNDPYHFFMWLRSKVILLSQDLGGEELYKFISISSSVLGH